MNPLLETKKEELKKMAEESVIFAADKEACRDFIRGIELVTDDEQGLKIIDQFIEMFNKEREEIKDNFERVIIP